MDEKPLRKTLKCPRFHGDELNQKAEELAALDF